MTDIIYWILTIISYVADLSATLSLLVFLPLAISRRLRSRMGTLIWISSYLMGIRCWLFSTVITYQILGWLGLIIGWLLFGIGVVPLALLGSLYNGLYRVAIFVGVLGLVTWVLRVVGIALMMRGENQEEVSEPTPAIETS